MPIYFKNQSALNILEHFEWCRETAGLLNAIKSCAWLEIGMMCLISTV